MQFHPLRPAEKTSPTSEPRVHGRVVRAELGRHSQRWARPLPNIEVSFSSTFWVNSPRRHGCWPLAARGVPGPRWPWCLLLGRPGSRSPRRAPGAHGRPEPAFSRAMSALFFGEFSDFCKFSFQEISFPCEVLSPRKRRRRLRRRKAAKGQDPQSSQELFTFIEIL